MAASSPPPSSSPLSSRRSHDGELAFLNHSPTTVANSLPPDVDNKPLARQKRRRTSKEDEEILKAVYEKNPKPDKATRMELVSKVALGEKEVQIWFQNRRQNDRRRARPFSHDTPFLMSSSSTMSDPPIDEEIKVPDIAEEEEHKPRDETPHTQDTEPANPTETTTQEIRVADDLPIPPKETVQESTETVKSDSQTTVDSAPIPSTDPQTADTAPTEVGSSQQPTTATRGASQSRSNWISNRRSASFMRCSDDYAPEVITFPHPVQPAPEPLSEPPTRTMKRAHSFVRISTNEDGTARVVTDLDKTPSPPHPKTNPVAFSRAAAGLRRSYSAAGFNERLAAAAREERSPKMPRTSNIGRSRDSRAWEFWCDPDSRYNTSLTTRAEQEGSGSAADAIGLLRANRRILSQNQARQNTPVLSRHKSAKMSDHYGIKKSRGPIQRASTINGRLQSKTSDSSETDELPQTESDKENWEPNVPKIRQSRQVAPTPKSRRQRHILGENPDIMSQSNSLGAMMDMSTPKKGDRRSSDPEQDDELRLFMGGSGLSSKATVSSAEEAGCVEGLLKLSQGQWR